MAKLGVNKGDPYAPQGGLKMPANALQTYRRLLSYLRPHRGMFMIGVLGMVLFAKGLGFLLKRPDDYYPGTSASPAGEERGHD